MRRPRWTRMARALALVAALLLAGCNVPGLPAPSPTPTPCAANCPPPQFGAGTAHTVSAHYFTLTYYTPWSVNSSDASGVTLAAGTQLGDVEVVVMGSHVPAGTTAQQLLNQTVQSQLDPNQFAGLQDNGPILGAEIGYVFGAGETFSGYATPANAPATPVYIEVMASVHGTTGLTLTTFSPVDPNSRDPSSLVPNAEYDRIVNSVIWT